MWSFVIEAYLSLTTHVLFDCAVPCRRECWQNYGLKLMKAGLSMGQIHQLIANDTSEMPMVYARMIQKNG
jgi:hypothetical protein